MGSEIIEVVERRRRWPVEVRLKILDEVLRPGISVRRWPIGMASRVAWSINGCGRCAMGVCRGCRSSPKRGRRSRR
jgi:hypothetical protein